MIYFAGLVDAFQLYSAGSSPPFRPGMTPTLCSIRADTVCARTCALVCVRVRCVARPVRTEAAIRSDRM